MELNISTLEQNVSVNSALNLSCVNTSFTATFETNKQPGNFTVKVSCPPVKICDHSVITHVITQCDHTVITRKNLYM